MIVVIDTNVWVSAMNFANRQSPPLRALELARNRHIIATCEKIEVEISRILTEKFEWQLAAVQYRLSFFLAQSVHTEISGTLRVCRDPNDDMVLECAVLAAAQFIVSGDKDLLALNPFRGIRIGTPAEFLAENA